LNIVLLSSKCFCNIGPFRISILRLEVKNLSILLGSEYWLFRLRFVELCDIPRLWFGNRDFTFSIMFKLWSKVVKAIAPSALLNISYIA